jgi:hypothetical protein
MRYLVNPVICSNQRSRSTVAAADVAVAITDPGTMAVVGGVAVTVQPEAQKVVSLPCSTSAM